MSLFVQRDWLYGRIIYLVANSYFKSSYCPLLSNGQSIFSRGKLAAKCPEIEFFSPTIMQKIFKILKKKSPILSFRTMGDCACEILALK